MKKLLWVISVVIIGAFTSCEKDIEFKQEEHLLTSASFDMCASQDCPAIDVSYITFKNPKILSSSVGKWTLKKINTTLNQDQTEVLAIENILQKFINDAQIGYPETTVLSDAHELSVEVVAMYTSNDVVSMGYYSDLFDGGAHGFYQEEYANFDPKTGVIFSNETLVTEEFYAFAKAKFSQSYPNSTFDIQPDTLTENKLLQLGFAQEGMLLRYHDPNMFPIADEEYKVTIPWQEADDYLTF